MNLYAYRNCTILRFGRAHYTNIYLNNYVYTIIHTYIYKDVRIENKIKIDSPTF